MSGTVSGGEEVGQQEVAVDGQARQAQPSGRLRGVLAVVAGLVVLAAGAGIAWRAGAFGSHGPSGTGQGAPPPATQPVVREDLSSTTPVTATLGYAESYTVIGRGGGALTWLPSAGQVIGQGQVLYRVDNGSPVVLLYGAVPAWRMLDEGLTGLDVTQLNHDLVALGCADSSDISALGWDYFSWETAYGVQKLESALGVSSPPGSLPLGSVVVGAAGAADRVRVSAVLPGRAP
jgi:multidrug efflux system membrane fusion protein